MEENNCLLNPTSEAERLCKTKASNQSTIPVACNLLTLDFLSERKKGVIITREGVLMVMVHVEDKFLANQETAS